MPCRTLVLALCLAVTACAAGCRSGAGTRAAYRPSPPSVSVEPTLQQTSYVDSGPGDTVEDADKAPESDELLLPLTVDPPIEAEQIPAPEPTDAPTLGTLAESVRLHFPLIRQAMAARTIASGEALAAAGAFDRKLKGYSNSQPLDFYKNYRQMVELRRDTYWGGEVYGGYRVGRGLFEPWYLERETNKGGEFNAGFVVPLSQNRSIDKNRAELWRAQLEQGRVEPEIRAMIIGSVRDATIAYWEWVAAAANYRVAEAILNLGVVRAGFIKRQFEIGEKRRLDQVDNQRIIVSRTAKVVEARQKLEQAAAKLSLFLRDERGEPIVLPIEAATVEFPETLSAEAWGAEANVALAQENRPELAELQVARQQLNVLLNQARNETLPKVDAGMFVSQDVGEPTSPKRDKSQLRLEATLAVEVPLERRNALGKARQLRGKIAQIRAKTQFAADKIAAEAQIAHTALTAAAERVGQTAEGLKLAEQMQAAEKRRFEVIGQSSLFELNIREQQTAEAAVLRIGALLDYYASLAEYAAALGFESVEDFTAATAVPDAPEVPDEPLP